METGIVEYQKISRKLGINLNTINDMLRRFKEIDRDGDGEIDLEEFAEYLNLPVTRYLEKLFELYDRVSCALPLALGGDVERHILTRCDTVFHVCSFPWHFARAALRLIPLCSLYEILFAIDEHTHARTHSLSLTHYTHTLLHSL